jgi:hypothetical protein
MRATKGAVMYRDAKARERSELIDEYSKWGVGAGILVVAVAPLAIPFLVLTLAFLLPLALPLIPLALIAGVVYLPVRIVQGIRRRRSGRGRPAEEEVLVGVELAPAHHPLVK